MKSIEPDLAGVLGSEATDKRIDILRRIAAAGSISEAARAAGVSYKAAWQALETLANLAGTPLVEKAVGGSGGGGAHLTPAGARVLEAAERLARARAEVLAGFEGPSGSPRQTPGLAALALRTSMRNQFPCRVVSVRGREGQVRVTLELPGGASLCSRVTRESAQLLSIAPGARLLALCKATAVEIRAEADPSDTRNRLAGVVERAPRGGRAGEAALRLPGGIGLVGFAGAGPLPRKGRLAVACLEDSSVVLAAWD